LVSVAYLTLLPILLKKIAIVNRRSTGVQLNAMAPLSEKPYLNFVIEPDLLKRVDDFRFKQRFATRAAAVKWLLDAALKAKLAPKETE
jgi:hypothetical protein